MKTRLGFLLAIMLVAGCGDNAEPTPPCQLGEKRLQYIYCRNALEQASRTVDTLIIDQADVDAAYALLRRVWLANDPIFRMTYVYPSSVRPDGFLLVSRDPGVTAALRAGSLQTGVADVDTLLNELPIIRIEHNDVVENYFDVEFDPARPVSAKALRARLAALPQFEEPEPDYPNRYDIVFREEAGVAVAAVGIGWGPDCVSGCTFWHDWDVRLPADGPALLEDLGGDVIPYEVYLRAMSELPPE